MAGGKMKIGTCQMTETLKKIAFPKDLLDCTLNIQT